MERHWDDHDIPQIFRHNQTITPWSRKGSPAKNEYILTPHPNNQRENEVDLRQNASIIRGNRRCVFTTAD